LPPSATEDVNEASPVPPEGLTQTVPASDIPSHSHPAVVSESDKAASPELQIPHIKNSSREPSPAPRDDNLKQTQQIAIDDTIVVNTVATPKRVTFETDVSIFHEA
jgi:hypothetical protein